MVLGFCQQCCYRCPHWPFWTCVLGLSRIFFFYLFLLCVTFILRDTQSELICWCAPQAPALTETWLGIQSKSPLRVEGTDYLSLIQPPPLVPISRKPESRARARTQTQAPRYGIQGPQLSSGTPATLLLALRQGCFHQLSQPRPS